MWLDQSATWREWQLHVKPQQHQDETKWLPQLESRGRWEYRRGGGEKVHLFQIRLVFHNEASPIGSGVKRLLKCDLSNNNCTGQSLA